MTDNFYQDRILYFWLEEGGGLKSVRQSGILRSIGGVRKLYEKFCDQKQVSWLIEALGENTYIRLKECLDRQYLEKQLYEIERAGVNFITPADDDFLDLLNIAIPPVNVLYYKGDISLLKDKCFTIVGTRSPSIYGKKMTKIFAEELAKHFVIVSGLATGIDTYAHKYAMEAGGKTIAILGNGINAIYPSVNYELSREIAKEGLLITEHKPDFRGTIYSYPQRNRLLSAISEGVLVIESGEKSGTMYTVEYALSQGKNVYALAGAADNPKVRGNLRLIRAAQCAMVYEPSHILCDYNITSEKKKSRYEQLELDFNELKILDILDKGALHYENILELSGLGVKELNSLLTVMEIKGLIEKQGILYTLA